MKIKTLLLGTSLSLIPQFVNAQCVATTDCATLGYTETFCPNGKGIKCPFGDKWACPSTETEFCEKYGFKYDCSGTGYASGSGMPCNNKYASCTCASGYEWKDGKCTKQAVVLGQCTGYAKNCKIADVLYSDGTCSAGVISGKTPIGVVVYIGGDGCGQALALEGVGSYPWSTENVDIPDLFNYINAPVNDFDSCENTKTVIDYSYKQYGDRASEYYPAFWVIYNYAPSSIPETKGKWCIPAGGVLDSIYQNKTAIDQSLIRINKPSIDNIVSGSWSWWSSSEGSDYDAWNWYPPSGSFGSSNRKHYKSYFCPVIEF